jgi:hypothetical protein
MRYFLALLEPLEHLFFVAIHNLLLTADSMPQ